MHIIYLENFVAITIHLYFPGSFFAYYDSAAGTCSLGLYLQIYFVRMICVTPVARENHNPKSHICYHLNLKCILLCLHTSSAYIFVELRGKFL